MDSTYWATGYACAAIAFAIAFFWFGLAVHKEKKGRSGMAAFMVGSGCFAFAIMTQTICMLNLSVNMLDQANFFLF